MSARPVMNRRTVVSLTDFFLSITLLACGSETDIPMSQPSVETLFSSSIDTIEIEVDYIAGAEPYTGALGRFEDLWELFQLNAERLFVGKKIVRPATLQEMEKLENEGGGTFGIARILDIAKRHRDLENHRNRATFYGIWLDGFLEDEQGIRKDVLGLSIGDTGVIAMFKPVLAGNEALPNVIRFSEQMTFIHEFGHAIGLVNRGIPLVSSHHDAEHPGHCSNDTCAMYYANSQLNALLAFASNFLDSGDTTVFGSQCLEDVDVFSGK